MSATRNLLGCLVLCAAWWAGCSDGTGGTPVCSGVVTADLGMGATPGCTGAWSTTGGQLCPQRLFCGVARTCMSFDDWPVGTCSCPEVEAHNDICCGLSIVAPADGATLTAAEDADPSADGIQVEVAVQGEECWPQWTSGPAVHLCDVAYDADAPAPAWWDRTTGRATAVVDLSGRTGCVSVCADILAIGEVAVSDSIELCLPSP